MARKIRIKRKVSGVGAPPVLEYGELACDSIGTVYIGDINGTPVTIQSGGGVAQDLYEVVSGTNPNGIFPPVPNALVTDVEGRGLVFTTSINTIDANSPIVGVINSQTSNYITQNLNFTGGTTDAMHFSYNLGTVTNAISFIGNDATANTQALQFLFNQGSAAFVQGIVSDANTTALSYISNGATTGFASAVDNAVGSTATYINAINNSGTTTVVQGITNSGTASVLSSITNSATLPAGIGKSLSNSGTLNYGNVITNTGTLGSFNTNTNTATATNFHYSVNGGTIASFLEFVNGGLGQMSGSNREMIRIQNLTSAVAPNDVKKMLVVRNDGAASDSVVYLLNINSIIPALELDQRSDGPDIRFSYYRTSDATTNTNGDLWFRPDEKRLKFYAGGIRTLALEEKSPAGGIVIAPAASQSIYTFSNLESLGAEITIVINDSTNNRITKATVVYDGTLAAAFVSPEFGVVDGGSFSTYTLSTSISGNDVSLVFNNTSGSNMTVWYKAVAIEV